MRTLRNVLTNKLYMSLVGVVAVFCLTVSYLITQTLDTPLLNRPDKVIIEMPSTGALFEGSSVTYRGVKIGKISKIDLTAEGTVEATATITNPIKIPADSDVKVRGLSPVGEQYLDFQPRGNTGPYLHDGSHVKATVTDLPKTLASTVINVNKVLDQLDPDDVHVALRGIGQALNGTGDDIGRIADQGYELLQTLDQYWPETQRLLRNGRTLGQLGVANADKIRTIAHSAALLGEFFRKFDPTLRALLASGPGQLQQIRDVITVVDEVLPKFLDRTIKVTNIIVLRDPHFRALLASYSDAIRTLGGAMYNGAARGFLVFQEDYQCYYSGARKHTPTDTKTYPVNPGARCANPPNNRLVRGAHNAPGPRG